MEKIARARAGFRSLSEALDSSSASGRMRMQIVASLRIEVQ
jgi:DNA invertase Pin-like site-specific DNA recombinase